MLVKIKTVNNQSDSHPAWKELGKVFTVDKYFPKTETYTLHGSCWLWRKDELEEVSDGVLTTSAMIKRQALFELEQENRRIEVDKLKEKLKNRKWWHKLFPFIISIRRRE